LIDPLFSHSFDLPAKLVFLEPKNELCYFSAIELFDHIDEHELDDSTLILY